MTVHDDLCWPDGRRVLIRTAAIGYVWQVEGRELELCSKQRFWTEAEALADARRAIMEVSNDGS